MTLTSGPLGARALLVQLLGDEFLARARFPEDEYIGFAWAHLFDELDDLADFLAVADDPGLLQPADLFFEVAVFAGQAHVFRRLFDHGQQFVIVRGLGQIIPGPDLHGFHGAADVAERGQHDHRGRHPLLVHLLQHIKAAHARHAHVQKDDVHGSGAQRGQAGRAVVRLPAP